MTGMIVLWFAMGTLIGALHAYSLWKSSQPPFHSAAVGLLRLLLIGGLLVAAAFNGGILPAAAGWAVACPVLVAGTYISSLKKTSI